MSTLVIVQFAKNKFGVIETDCITRYYSRKHLSEKCEGIFFNDKARALVHAMSKRSDYKQEILNLDLTIKRSYKKDVAA